MLSGYGVFFCNSGNLHTRDVTKKESHCSHIDYIIYYVLFICLFEVNSPNRELFTHMETYGCKCLAPMAIEQ